MKTKIKMINGVKCRALKEGEERKFNTDLFENGDKVTSLFFRVQGKLGFGEMGGNMQAYRPIPKKKVERVASFKGWGWKKKDGSLFVAICYNKQTAKVLKDRGVIVPVLITEIKRGRK